jgi:hypothetical protein
VTRDDVARPSILFETGILQHSDFIEVCDQFWLHFFDLLWQAAYHFVEESKEDASQQIANNFSIVTKP